MANEFKIKNGAIISGSITGITEQASENSTKMASTAWVKLQNYLSTLPIATASVLGAIKVGSGLAIDAQGVLSIPGAEGNTLRTKQSFTATAAQTTFTVTGGYVAGLIDVYVNGVLLTGSSVTTSNGSTIVLTDAAEVGDIVDVVTYSPINGGFISGTTDTLVEGTTNLYFTNARARAAISLTTTGTSGAATYNSSTGVLNIPQYQGGVTSFNTRTGAITLTSGDVTTALGFTPENAANKGVANGYASLDGSGLVPSSQLPSYVDDVLEYTNLAGFPATGTTGKIYVDLATNKIYRWSGTVYIEVSAQVGTTWGGITGTLSNQTDLQTALNGKQASLSGTGFVKISGTTISYDNSTYLTASTVLNAVLTPYVVGANTAVTSSDTIETAIEKLQGQINARLSAESDTLATVTGRGATTSTALSITNATATTSASTGALVVSGGIGVAGSVFIGTNLTTGGLTMGQGITNQNVLLTISNPGIGYANGFTFQRGTDGAGIRVIETASDTIMYEIHMSDNPDSSSDIIQLRYTDWQSPNGLTVPIQVSGRLNRYVAQTHTFYGGISQNTTGFFTTSNFGGTNGSDTQLVINDVTKLRTSGSSISITALNTSGYNTTDGTLFWIKLDTTTTFAWGYGSPAGTAVASGIALSTSAVTLSNGIQVTFSATTGTVGDTFAARVFKAAVNSFANITATSFIRSGGTSSQFLKADGSVDSSTYLTAATVLNTVLTPYAVGANTAVTASDTIETAIEKLQGQVNARISANQTITVSGDASGSGTTAITLTLANSGVTAGTYQAVTVDAKGRVTAGSNPTTVSGYGITDFYSQVISGFVVGANTAITNTDTLETAIEKLQGQVNARISANQSITLSGDATGSGTTAITVTLANSGVTAGTYNNVTVNAKGLVTSGSNVSYLTSYTETDTLATVTGRGASSSTQITLSGAGDNSTTYSSLRFAGYNQGGGTGYHGFFEVHNTFGSATNPKKFFRMNSTGAIEIINSAYTANIFTLLDNGQLRLPSYTATTSFTGTAVGTLGFDANGNIITVAAGGGSGSVTSVSGTGTVAGLTLTGTVTSSGSLTLGGTLDITSATGLLRSRLAPSGVIDSLNTTNFRTTLFGSSTSGNQISTARWNTTPTFLNAINPYSTMLAWAGSDTHGFIAMDYNTAVVIAGGGNADTVNWSKRLAFTDGTGASGTWGINITGTAASETLATVAGRGAVTSTAVTFNGGITISDGNVELYKAQTVDMSNTAVFSTSNYYPVTIPISTELMTITIQNNLNSNVPSWATHGGGFTLNLKWMVCGSGWGTTDIKRKVIQYHERFNNQTICGGITQMGNSSQEVVWLRGGGRYYFYFSRNVTARAQSTSYTSNSQTVSPTSSAQNGVWDSAAGAENYYASSILVTSLTETSSSRYKENISVLTNPLERINKIRGVTYNRIGDTKKEVGVIAEEVASVLPEVIGTKVDGTVDSVSYGRLTAVLIEAVKEQQKQIEELKALLVK